MDGYNLLLTWFRHLIWAERQLEATAAAQQLPKLSELSQREVVTKEMCTM